jgi:predicted RNA binding protein YcfA (HicA-like mRNA interferase family)
VKKTSGSHKTLSREGWPNVIFAHHDREELGPRILSRIGKETGLTPGDLSTRRW